MRSSQELVGMGMEKKAFPQSVREGQVGEEENDERQDYVAAVTREGEKKVRTNGMEEIKQIFSSSQKK